MAEESFILLNLKEGKAKKLAQVISNETSRKILDFLAKKEATETEIAKELGVPISTVHYSLSHLKEVNLVQSDEFHYSQKGKVVEHYKLSNKMVIIAPSQPSVESIKEKLIKLFPAALIGIFGAGTIYLSNFLQDQFAQNPAPMLAAKMAMDTGVANVAANSGVALGGESADAMMYASRAISPEAISTGFTMSPALWFLAGAITALTAYFVVDLIRARIRKNKSKSK